MGTDAPSSVSRTARYMALFRALETARNKERLFEDPFAIYFLPFRMRAAARLARLSMIGRLVERGIDARWPGTWSSAVARTRLIDNWLREAITAGAGQVVILGAGFDCRALRLPALANLPVFEVDRSALLTAKRRRLHSKGLPGHAHLHDVPVDFLRDDLGARLSACGLRRGERMVFVWEGVTNYLDAAAVAAVFDLVSRISASGSRIIFTYVHADVLTGRFSAPGLERIFNRLAASGETWTFGFRPENLSDYLLQRGLRLLEDLGAAEYRHRVMGRRARGLVGYEFYRVAMAEVIRSKGTLAT
jgi:methyltransferase (TIGR00027 family)